MIRLISYSTNRFQASEYYLGVDLIKQHLIDNGHRVTSNNITIESYPYTVARFKTKEKTFDDFQSQIPEIFQLKPIIQLIQNYKNNDDLLKNTNMYFTDLEFKNLNGVIDYANNFKVEDGDIVGQQVLYLFLFHCILFILQLKKNNPTKKIISVFGGYHITLSEVTREFLSKFDFIDYLIVNDGRKPLNDIANGTSNEKIIIGNYRDLNISYPKYSSVERKLRYNMQFIFNIGCPNHCKFCASEREHLHYDLNVAKEYLITQNKIKPIQELTFVDDAINPSKKRIIEICDMLIDLKNNHNVKFKWSGHAYPGTMDDEIVERLVKSNCFRLFLGAESFDDDILTSINKGCLSAKTKDTIQKLNKANIQTQLGLIVNLPGETDEKFQKSLDVLNEIKNDNIAIVPTLFKLFPNSHFYKYPEESNIKVINWEQDIVDSLEEIKGMVIPKEWYYTDNINIDAKGRIDSLLEIIKLTSFRNIEKELYVGVENE